MGRLSVKGILTVLGPFLVLILASVLLYGGSRLHTRLSGEAELERLGFPSPR